MILNQEQIRRMTGAGGGGAGGGGSFDPSAAGMASQSWVEENYVSKQYFGRLFTANGTQKVYTSTDGGETWGTPVVATVTIAPNEITPSETITDGETSGTKIKTVRELSSIQALVGLWTQKYLSALGQNSSGGGGGGGSTTLAGLLDVNIPDPMTQANNGQVLMYNYSQNKWINANLPPTGVTSVGMTVPTGFSVSTATITSSGTFAISFASGYSLPLTADVTKGVTAYGWGDHAQAGYALASNVYTKTEADQKFMTIAAFENLFNALDSSSQKVSHPYSSGVASIKAMVGLWTNQYLSALGLNSSGGGGGASTLNDLLDVNISSPTNGQILKYDSTSGKWVNGSAGGVGTVTSITAGTGLSGGTITSSGTIAINSTYQGYISHGETAYGWGDHAQAGYATPSSVASQMQTYAKIQNGTITIGDTSITPLISDSGTFWGQSWASGGTVSGDMSNVGNIVASAHGTKYIEGFRTIELYGAAASDYGGYIDFHFNDDSNDFTSRIIEDASGRIYLNASNGVRIGNGVLKWDSTNNALKVEKYDGTTANFYATGGVSALGVGTGGSVTNLDVTGKITFADNYKIEVSAGDMYIGDSTSEQYVKVSDMCSWNGSTYWYITASGNARFQRIYLDASRYIYVSNGTFYFYNGSTSKEIAFV